MIDAASGGALVDKTPDVAGQLIANMAANSQQFGVRGDPVRGVNEMAVGQIQQHVKACKICLNTSHPTDSCPTLQEDATFGVNAVGRFPGLFQPRWDLSNNAYNLGWRDHPNLRYGNLNAIMQQPYYLQMPSGFPQTFAPRPPQRPNNSGNNTHHVLSQSRCRPTVSPQLS